MLNDRIPDGTDVSWIWDVDTERVVKEELGDAIATALNLTGDGETLYILPTYSAMLEVRQIPTGRKIL